MRTLILLLLLAAIALPAAARPKTGLGTGLTMDNTNLISAAVQSKSILSSVKNPKDEKEISRVAGEFDKMKDKVGIGTVADALKLVSLDHEDLRPLALSFLQRYLSTEQYGEWIKTMTEELTKRSRATSEPAPGADSKAPER